MFWLLVGTGLAVVLFVLIRPLLRPSPLTTPQVYVAVLLTACLPAAAILSYLHLGSPSPQRPPPDSGLDDLHDRLAQQPDDLQAWLLLIDSLISVGHYAEALRTLTALHPQFPNEVELLLRHAEMLAILADGNLLGEPTILVQRALAIQPDHPRGLWLAARAAEKRGDNGEALTYWQRLAPQLQGEVLAQVQEHMAHLSHTSDDQDSAPPAPAGPAGIAVQVSIADALREHVVPGSVLFVFARDPDGPPMPVAVARREIDALPQHVVLDDSQSPMPTRRLSALAVTSIAARISASGEVRPQPGDLTASPITVPTDHTGTVQLMIDQLVR